MGKSHVYVPTEIIIGFEKAAMEKINFKDQVGTVNWLIGNGYHKTVDWIQKNQTAYKLGSLIGFERIPTKEESDEHYEG